MVFTKTPAQSVSVSILQHNNAIIILGAVKQIARILVEEYLDDIEGTSTVFFNCNLWERFFNLCVDFCCQPSLQLEKMTELKRKRILDLYGDMRLTMNTLMLDKWRMLGNFQANFVPGMVGPFLKVSLLPHEGLRKATIPVFFDMMEHEWKYNKNFHRMEIEMIDKLDVYLEKLTDFNARLQSTFPFAKFLTKLEPPGLDIIESTDQYIQSCAVEPLPDPNIMKKFEGKQVKEEITRYCRTNNVKHFLLKRPFHQGKKDKSNEYKTLHIERTVYTTEYQFPGILRWFPVVDSEVTVLNPIENGAELIEDN
uniref:DOCKER domain-containing protein n=1 Tax=Amphimedon queenslandica TaxID=400682 RepID=A0A1X7SZB9_AMPQE